MRKTLDQLTAVELKAAMTQTGGAQSWGTWGSAFDHVRYAMPIDPKSRRRCWCGCKRRATHRGVANGVTLMSGCELLVARWVRDPRSIIRSLSRVPATEEVMEDVGRR